MPYQHLIQTFLLPELKFSHSYKSGIADFTVVATKRSQFEVCPKCATPSSKVHDRRTITLKDAPIRGKYMTLKVTKRRFRCPNCKSVFTEPIQGVNKGGRLTQRFVRSIYWACENFQDLKRVKKAHRCGYKTIYKSYYKQLRLKQKERENNPWPKTIGIDEHGFSKDKRRGARNFATLIVDYQNKRPKELIQGKSHQKLIEGLSYIPGRENVSHVVIDLADSYKTFVQKFFPNAKIVADKFHVLRLITPTLNSNRIAVTGDKRTHKMRKLLLRNRGNLHFEDRIELDHWLKKNPDVFDAYWAKEKLHTVYRCRGLGKARRSLNALIKWLETKKLKPLQRLKNTLKKWSEEILRYFSTRITNARTEAFNNNSKLVQKRAYGFKSFANYRLKVLNAYG